MLLSQWSEMNKEYLFVYGTLRKDYELALKNELAAYLQFAGTGKIKAKLYDLGSYPAAVEGLCRSEIAGDVFEVIYFARLFPVLDVYEGSEYKRGKAMVTMDGGDVLNAWIYWYTGSIDENLRIPENDYLHYLKNKKDRFV
jgi:gamma-glutamylcyclotransferase (GGCT)/AIG2-like uncharacterized protein YtfP